MNHQRAAGTKRFAGIPAVLILCSILLSADDRHVDFDVHTDFSKIKTFAIHQPTIDSQRPELNNSLFARKLGDAVRDALASRGLKESADHPDIFADYMVAGKDYSVVEQRPDVRIPGGLGQPGTIIRGTGPESVRFSEGTLIIDLTTRDAGTLVWRGVYREQESNGSKLAQKLPRDAKSIISKYPPKPQK